MRRGRTSCLDLVFWRKPPRRLKLRKLWLRFLQNRHLGSEPGTTTSLTCVVFYQKVPLRSTAAGTSASTSRTASHTTIASSSSNSQETNPPAANLNPSPANKSHTAIFKHSFTSITNCRQSCPLFAELEADYLKSLDARSNERLPPGIFQPPIPGIPSPHCGQVTLRAAADRGGDTSPTPEAGGGQDQPQPRPVCEQSIPGHKERWLLPPSDQSEATELLPSEATFQDGGNWDAERSPTSVRLDVLN